MEISYRELETPDELHAVTRLEADAWGRDDSGTSVPAHMFKAILHAGGHMLGAFDDERLVGFTLAFPSRTHSMPTVWSHMVAVHPAYQGTGIGTCLKFGQRDWALQHGFEAVGWTFDPLQRGNANQNIHRLGGLANAYAIDFYGALPDGINAGMPTDRMEIVWLVNDPRVKRIVQGESVEPFVAEYPAEQFLLRGNEGFPELAQDLSFAEEFYFVEIPYDINTMKRAEKDKALQWQSELRKVAQAAFANGYQAVDFITESNRCWYVLKRSEA